MIKNIINKILYERKECYICHENLSWYKKNISIFCICSKNKYHKECYDEYINYCKINREIPKCFICKKNIFYKDYNKIVNNDYYQNITKKDIKNIIIITMMSYLYALYNLEFFIENKYFIENVDEEKDNKINYNIKKNIINLIKIQITIFLLGQFCYYIQLYFSKSKDIFIESYFILQLIPSMMGKIYENKIFIDYDIKIYIKYMYIPMYLMIIYLIWCKKSNKLRRNIN